MKRNSWIYIVVGVFCMVSAFFLFHYETRFKSTPEQEAIQRHQGEIQKKGGLKKILKLPAAPSTIEASKYLTQLMKSGQLPGAEKTYLRSEVIKDMETNYPILRTFIQSSSDSRYTNHYTVAKSSADASWQLTRAWKTDVQNKLVEEYPVQNP